jgi:glycosyltransferase involved in cell wall biosynthesis
MRILLITANFATAGRNPWLLDDLAAAFVEQGHEVDVIVADPKGGRARGLEDRAGVRVLSVGPVRARDGRVGRLLGHLASGAGLHGRGYRFARTSRYDLAIHTSIAAFSWGLPARLRRRGIAKRLTAVLWDFFPIHQVEIGRMRRSPASAAAKLIERRLLARADTIAVMSPANERFHRRYFGIDRPTVIVPPWSNAGREISTGDRDWGSSTVTAVFGGQLTLGRGLETLLEAAALLEADAVPVDLVIAGDGPARARVELAARNLGNVRLTGQLPRAEYRRLLGSAHVGIAITVAGVSPPTFPSKIVEYAGAGLWIVVAVEASSDAGELVQAHGAGTAVDAGDPRALADALRDAAIRQRDGILASGGDAARALWTAELSADVAARRLADTAG